MKSTRPLVECLTNRVTINDCANMLLAMGASPIMAEIECE
ncbi:MAG: hydroxyethylthiazole kinase, partial [Monoglobus pectinilyticus]